MIDETGVRRSLKNKPTIHLLASRKYWAWVLVIVLVAAGGGLTYWAKHHKTKPKVIMTQPKKLTPDPNVKIDTKPPPGVKPDGPEPKLPAI